MCNLLNRANHHPPPITPMFVETWSSLHYTYDPQNYKATIGYSLWTVSTRQVVSVPSMSVESNGCEVSAAWWHGV